MQRFSSPCFSVGFGLAFDVEKAPTRSGFRPARCNLRAQKELFGDLRLQGFAAALELNYVGRLLIIGGGERRYSGETVEADGRKIPINRAWAIREMLVGDFKAASDRVAWAPSVGNTRGNAAAIQAIIGCPPGVPDYERRFVVISSHYHLPRAQFDLAAGGCWPSLMAAEALWLATVSCMEDRSGCKRELAARFGGGPLAERAVEEINGLADQLLGQHGSASNVA